MTQTASIRAFAAALAMSFAAIGAHAAAPQVKTQAPGYYRMMLGDFEVTALSDGTIMLDAAKLLLDTTAVHVEQSLKRDLLKSPVETSVNGFLINTGSKLVLVDTGTNGLFGPTAGTLVANLKAAGYRPEQVDEIYITHMHGDHVGGLMTGGTMAFPNATVRAGQADADYWLSKENLDKAPAAMKGFFQGAQGSLNAYVAAGHFKPFSGDTDLVDGIKAIAAPGHTPGHSVYQVESKGQKLLLWGDLIHVGSVQFPEPAITIQYDSDTKAAYAQRKRMFAQVEADGTLIGASHLSFPGLGHIRAEGKGYRWIPLPYGLVK